MYIQNRRNSSKFNGCSPLQLLNCLIGLESAIAYFAYTKRWLQYNEPLYQIDYLLLTIKKIKYETGFNDFFGFTFGFLQ